eukprot:TRINITY_DN61411_c0_g1_i1.p1 TRINITY_DN61411_c0_g1~~TRINITY_DN61411_c0_g1_i1.p1  ORF type:complete len:405 (+),score=83.82 TRINITY_DN61411_c0_g1_i1:61-1275(+)
MVFSSFQCPYHVVCGKSRWPSFRCCILCLSLAARQVTGFAACDAPLPQKADGAPAGPFIPGRLDVSKGPHAWQEAMDSLWRDGAVILSGLESVRGELEFAELARIVPSRIFTEGGRAAPSLLSPDAPVSAVHGELTELKMKGAQYLPGSGLLPHTDGYAYGDYMPDFIFLLCEQASARGGSNTLIDGEALLRAMQEGDSDSRHLAEWLRHVAVDLSEGEGGLSAGRQATGPIMQRHSAVRGSDRLKWRRQIRVNEAQKLKIWHPLSSSDNVLTQEPCSSEYHSLWQPLAGATAKENAAVWEKLRSFDAILQVVGAEALANHSFRLERGEALVVDNYRVLHGRAPYLPEDSALGMEDVNGSMERRMWRVWSWTSQGSGLPPDGARTSQPVNDEVFGKQLKSQREL